MCSFLSLLLLLELLNWGLIVLMGLWSDGLVRNASCYWLSSEVIDDGCRLSRGHGPVERVEAVQSRTVRLLSRRFAVKSSVKGCVIRQEQRLEMEQSEARREWIEEAILDEASTGNVSREGARAQTVPNKKRAG